MFDRKTYLPLAAVAALALATAGCIHSSDDGPATDGDGMMPGDGETTMPDDGDGMMPDDGEEEPAGSWLLDPASVRSVTGAQMPGFSSDDVGESVSRLKAAANVGLGSDVLVFFGDGPAVRGQTTCLNVQCSVQVGMTSHTISVSELDFGGSGSAHQAVASHRGVSLAEGRGEGLIANFGVDYNTYGGWLQHSLFAVQPGSYTSGPFEGGTFIISYTAGDAPNTNPEAAGGSGTWSGVMVGADVSQTATHGNLIQGDAEITIADFADPQADIAFTQIFDLSTETQRADMTWGGIEVTEGGFVSGADGNSIEGRFYGSNHEEVGGIFERDQVLGAFGAERE